MPVNLSIKAVPDHIAHLGKHLTNEVLEVDHSEVIELARKAGLSSFDTSYLWLALHLGGGPVTLDRKLIKAALEQY